jgi:hypothetical protein
MVSCRTTDFKPVKQEVNSTVMLPPLVFPGITCSFMMTVDLRFDEQIKAVDNFHKNS